MLTDFISLLSKRPFIKATVIFCIGAIMGIVAVQFAPIQFDVQMRTKETGALQYFVDTGSGFNELQSKRINILESSDFKHYLTSMGANDLRSIRIDPISSKGEFELLGLQVDYLFWHRQWYGAEELVYLTPAHQIEIKSTKGATLNGIATGNDPFFITYEVEYLKHWQLLSAILFAVLGGVGLIGFMQIIRNFENVRKLLVYEHTTLIIIVAVGALSRLIYWFNSRLPSDPSQLWSMWPDEGTYFSIAQYIMTNGLMDYLLSEQSVMAAPGNPLYLALMYTVTNSVDAIRFINVIFSVLTIIWIYKLGMKIYNKPIGLLAAALIAVHGQLIGYSPTLLTEPLFFFLFIAGIYYLGVALELKGNIRWRQPVVVFLAAFFLSIAILTKSVPMLLPVLLFLAIGAQEVYRSWHEGRLSFPLLKRSALPLILPVFIVFIIGVKNDIYFDRFTMATGSGAALWLGSRADTEGDEPPYRGKNYDTQDITLGASHLSLQGDMLLIAAAKKNIVENPLGYVWWDIKKIGRLLVGNNLAWFYPFKNIFDWHQSMGQNIVTTALMAFQITMASLIVVYGTLGFLTVRMQGMFGLIIPVSVGYLIIFSLPFLVIQRYGLPVVLLLSMPASALIYGAWHDIDRLRRVAVLGLPFLIAILMLIMWGY